jgi:hypothetical protein
MKKSSKQQEEEKWQIWIFERKPPVLIYGSKVTFLKISGK